MTVCGNVRVVSYCCSRRFPFLVDKIECYSFIIEKPEIICKYFSGQMAGQVADIFAYVDIVYGFAEQPPLIVAVRYSDNPDTAYRHSALSQLSHSFRPFPPRFVRLGNSRLAFKESAKGLGFAGYGV